MNQRLNLAHDLFLPTVLFGALGGMTWAVRGCSGFGASAGCIFAGVALGAAWWFIARQQPADSPRRYQSGWIILAMTVAFGIAGNRGWMQWPSFFDNRLFLDSSKNDFVYIPRIYGFVWMFLAGVPWAGLGACGIALCSPSRRVAPWVWILRIACAIGTAWLLSEYLYPRYPHVFLPLYDTLNEQYHELKAHHELWKLVRDNREAMFQLGLYLGICGFELVRRDWKNVTLILSVGVLNGLGWAMLQAWTWAPKVWPGAQFNFWRSWESTGGISIGIAYGIAYFLVNRPQTSLATRAQADQVSAARPGLGWLVAYVGSILLLVYIAPEVMPNWCATSLAVVAAVFGVAGFGRARAGTAAAPLDNSWSIDGPHFERFGAYAGLILGLGLSIKNGLKGGANIYLGDERYWNQQAMYLMGPLMILALAAAALWILARPRQTKTQADVFPHAYALMWLVLIVQNAIAQLITGPPSNWNEVVYSLYYVLLFLISAVVVHHYHCCGRQNVVRAAPSTAGAI